MVTGRAVQARGARSQQAPEGRRVEGPRCRKTAPPGAGGGRPDTLGQGLETFSLLFSFFFFFFCYCNMLTLFFFKETFL